MTGQVCRKNFRLSNKLAMTVLRSSFKVFLAVTIIFYEVVVVYHIFAEHSKTVAIDVRGLSKDDLREYVVTKDGAMEFVFRKAGEDHESQLFLYMSFNFL